MYVLAGCNAARSALYEFPGYMFDDKGGGLPNLPQAVLPQKPEAMMPSIPRIAAV